MGLIYTHYDIKWASLVAQWEGIHLPRQEPQMQPPGQEDPLDKEVATHPSILAWEIPWTEEPGGATVHRVAKESDMTERLNNNNIQST